MKYYFAPMEGITGYIYRRAYGEFFGGIDKYFSPFLVPHTEKDFNSREKNDILPEHNKGNYLVPQILTNQAKDFIRVAKALQEYGYEEVNLNLGCPSGTVASKKKGAGFLACPKELEQFLDEIFEKLEMKISIKTRIGFEDKEEFPRLMEIYNQYEMEELIIHPRLRTDYYKNEADWELFAKAVAESKNIVCYNGDLFTEPGYEKWKKKFPEVERVMFGRGLLANPGLIEAVQTGKELKKEKLKAFHDRLCEDYANLQIGDRNVLFKMKELWHYMIMLFPDSKKLEKKIKKAQNLDTYRMAVDALFRERDIESNAGYQI